MGTINADIVIPEWVNWIAVDWDGVVRGYSNEPKALSYSWENRGGYKTILYKGKKPKNWKDELCTWS